MVNQLLNLKPVLKFQNRYDFLQPLSKNSILSRKALEKLNSMFHARTREFEITNVLFTLFIVF